MLPEGAPSDKALAQVFVVCGLEDQVVDLFGHVQQLFGVKISPRQLVPYSLNNVQGLLVQGFRRVGRHCRGPSHAGVGRGVAAAAPASSISNKTMMTNDYEIYCDPTSVFKYMLSTANIKKCISNI